MCNCIFLLLYNVCRFIFVCECISSIEYVYVANIKDVKYLRIFANIKTGYEYCNLLFFLLYFLKKMKVKSNYRNHLW